MFVMLTICLIGYLLGLTCCTRVSTADPTLVKVTCAHVCNTYHHLCTSVLPLEAVFAERGALPLFGDTLHF